jgi:hypothetical protein
MPDMIEFRLESGDSVLVAVDDTSGEEVVTRGWGDDRGRRAASRANETLEAALAKVRPVADAVLESLSGLASRPGEITVEFAIQMTSEADIYIAKLGAAASFKIAMTWRPDGSERSGDVQ